MRLDLWLWAARFFKTRALAAQAIDGGRVDLNDGPAKRGKQIKVGDRVAFRIGPYHYDVIVRALAERRGPAKVAVTLYEETAASVAARQAHAERLKQVHPIFYDGAGRPTKKQRRAIDQWKGRIGG